MIGKSDVQNMNWLTIAGFLIAFEMSLVTAYQDCKYRFRCIYLVDKFSKQHFFATVLIFFPHRNFCAKHCVADERCCWCAPFVCLHTFVLVIRLRLFWMLCFRMMFPHKKTPLNKTIPMPIDDFTRKYFFLRQLFYGSASIILWQRANN